MCVRVCDRGVHLRVGIWGSAAVGALLPMAAHCSLSVRLSLPSLSQPVYGPPLFHRAHPK